jgi:hypothetical protein
MGRLSLTTRACEQKHGSYPMLERTLERSGQCAGVERLRDGRQLCLKFFMRMESGESVDWTITTAKIYTHVGLRHLNTVDANTTPAGLKSSAGMNKTIN